MRLSRFLDSRQGALLYDAFIIFCNTAMCKTGYVAYYLHCALQLSGEWCKIYNSNANSTDSMMVNYNFAAGLIVNVGKVGIREYNYRRCLSKRSSRIGWLPPAVTH